MFTVYGEHDSCRAHLPLAVHRVQVVQLVWHLGERRECAPPSGHAPRPLPPRPSASPCPRGLRPFPPPPAPPWGAAPRWGAHVTCIIVIVSGH